jgi:hypothetical protein
MTAVKTPVTKNGEFCANDKYWAKQKEYGENCNQSYECLTNYCSAGLCASEAIKKETDGNNKTGGEVAVTNDSLGKTQSEIAPAERSLITRFIEWLKNLF